MRRLALLAFCALSLISTAQAASAAQARHRAVPSCPPAHAHVLLADPHAVVYTIVEHIKGQYEVETELATRGCVDGRKGSYKLAQERIPAPLEPGGLTRDFALNGTMVAYEESAALGDRYESLGTEYHVVVRDLRTGRVLHDIPTGVPLRAPKPHETKVGVGNLVALVVTGDGAAAWIAEDYGRSTSMSPGGLFFDVYAVDSSGTRLLAAGTDIDPTSLALSAGTMNLTYPQVVAGTTVYWTEAGKASSTPLY
ncbi:MAG TPA: hypothetical protein VHT29_11255 [Solirubrobacteraceae bacterium]|jgi:hypothetical protein|nr:hypothetical protein [Solirubrobacteraceae bacterium]